MARETLACRPHRAYLGQPRGAKGDAVKARSAAGSTIRLLEYCLGYYASYVVYGIAVKYFQASPDKGFPGLSAIQWLVYSTIGGSIVALFVCLGLRWYRLQSNRLVEWGPLRIPSE